MRSRKLQARDSENGHPVPLSTGLKGKLADREARPAKSQEVQAASFHSLCIRVCCWRDGEERWVKAGLVRAAASAPKNKAVKANAPGGGATGQVGKAFKCTIFYGPQWGMAW